MGSRQALVRVLAGKRCEALHALGTSTRIRNLAGCQVCRAEAREQIVQSVPTGPFVNLRIVGGFGPVDALLRLPDR